MEASKARVGLRPAVAQVLNLNQHMLRRYLHEMDSDRSQLVPIVTFYKGSQHQWLDYQCI